MFFAPQEGVTLSTPATRPCRGTGEPLSMAAVFTLQDRDDVLRSDPPTLTLWRSKTKSLPSKHD